MTDVLNEMVDFLESLLRYVRKKHEIEEIG